MGTRSPLSDFNTGYSYSIRTGTHYRWVKAFLASRPTAELQRVYNKLRYYQRRKREGFYRHGPRPAPGGFTEKADNRRFQLLRWIPAELRRRQAGP